VTDPHDPEEPAPEDPNRFPLTPRVAPLDESPDGTTPSDPNEPSPESLPPGS
jgi:hypothetical protein